ncbi:MAG: pyridoxal-phosphate dependent enzyme [Leptolinea sp.]
MAEIFCTLCAKKYPQDRIVHLCPDCGGVYDFNRPPEYEKSKIDRSLPGIWKYRHSFSLQNNSPLISLGEGDTPFFWDKSSTREIGFKLESQNPTGSYKDRGTALIISQMAALGIQEAVEDSSGNAGASFAGYCARAGMKARVFVPESAAGPKRRQIEQYGATLSAIPGARSEAARAVLEAVAGGLAYGSHAFLPFGLPGIATIAYELLDQINGSIGSVIAPAGHGGLLLGIMRGFAALQQAGEIARQPYYVGVQAEPCSPMELAYREGLQRLVDAPEGATLAEGVRVAKPVRAKAIMNELQNGAGEIIAIPESDLMPAYRELAGKGIYCEPTSALVWAALTSLKERLPYPIILIISGNGLKYYPD